MLVQSSSAGLGSSDVAEGTGSCSSVEVHVFEPDRAVLAVRWQHTVAAAAAGGRRHQAGGGGQAQVAQARWRRADPSEDLLLQHHDVEVQCLVLKRVGRRVLLQHRDDADIATSRNDEINWRTVQAKCTCDRQRRRRKRASTED